MNKHTIAALQIKLEELNQRKNQLIEMADQYNQRVVDIKTGEIPEIEDEIRGIMADLGN